MVLAIGSLGTKFLTIGSIGSIGAIGTMGSVASSDTIDSIGNFIGSSGTIFGFHVTS